MAPVERRTWKIPLLVTITSGFALWFAFQFRAWINEPTLERAVLVFAIAALWLAAATLVSFLLDDGLVAGGFALLQGIAFWLPTSERFSGFVVIGAGVLVAFSFIAFLRAEHELKNSLKIDFFRMGVHGARFSMIGLVLFVTFTIVQIFNLPTAELHRSALDSIIKGSEPFVGKFIPGFSREKTVDEILRALVTAESEAGNGEIEKKVKELKTRVSEATGVSVEGKLKDFLYDASFAKIFGLPPAYKLVVLVGIGILIFGVIKVVGMALLWIAIALAAGMFHMLRAAGFVTVTLENAKQEVIIIT